MDDTPADGTAFDDVKGLLRSISGGNYYRFVNRFCKAELLAEPELLQFSGTEIVIIIQTDFADGNDFFVSRKATEFFDGLGGHFADFVRVYADGCVNVVIFFSQTDAFLRAFQVAADVDYMVNTARGEKL